MGPAGKHRETVNRREAPTMTDLFWGYWEYQIPNYLLSAVIWTLLGRFLLGLFVPADWNNYIWRGFRIITDPFVRLTSMVTPQFILPMFLPIFAAFWLAAIRLLFFVVMAANGLVPPVEAGAQP
jgi:uncharacterized protein YggT (Ycf19 family)